MIDDRTGVARALAAALLDGPWDVTPGNRAQTVAPAAVAIGVGERRLQPVVLAIVAAYRDPPLDRRRELAHFIETIPQFDRMWRRRPHPVVRAQALPVGAMVRRPWRAPVFDRVLDLADWAEVSGLDLEWYADVRSLERVCSPRLRHYDRRWVYTRARRVRLLEAPRARIKALQRRLLDEVVGLIPVHDAAHGFVPSRSVLTAARPHAGQEVVVHLDLEAFFATVTAARVFGVLRMAGYPEPVAHALTGLMTTVLPRVERRQAPPALRDEDLPGRHNLLSLLSRPHLPQGSPTSPALANLVAYRLDRRLSGLATASGFEYTRYADDLAFSTSGGNAQRRSRRLIDSVRGIVRDSGFRINPVKTRIMPASQRQLLFGVVVNITPAAVRRERDELRAILHNCRCGDPQDQNREGHPEFRAQLLGRIAWVESLNVSHGRRLRDEFDAISW
jgi:hypothetical protein